MGAAGHARDVSAVGDPGAPGLAGLSHPGADSGRAAAADTGPASAGRGRTDPTRPSPATGARTAGRRYPVGAASLALAAVVLWAGYTHRWPWTGINGHTATLWDWLHLMLLPVVVAVLPVWLSRKAHLRRAHKTAGLATFGVFVLLVIVGYTASWGWTGFVGNKLWDWLELLALPLAVALAPLCADLRTSWSARHTLVGGGLVAVFLVPVLGGYLGHWGWTGFAGNTLWDWLNLFLLPLLVPTIVVPAIASIATEGVLEARTATEQIAAAVVTTAVAAEVAAAVATEHAERAGSPPIKR